MFKNVKIFDDFALRDNERQTSFNKIIASNLESKELSKKIIKNIINQIQSKQPLGFIHLFIFHKILKRPIRIWRNGHLVQTLGKRKDNVYIDAAFKEGKNVSTVGHWTFRHGNNPIIKSSDQNDCLYQVIYAQTGISPTKLKFKTIRAIKSNEKSIVRIIMDSVDPDATINYMTGGAAYRGYSSRDAKNILDASQNGRGHPDGRSGHPRGHASYSFGSRSEDSIESYSYSRWRSGFLSRGDQDLVAHYTLITNQAQNLMDELNNGQHKVARHIGRTQLDYDPLPKAQIWSGGRREGTPADFNRVCIVGKHFLNQNYDPNADIFVLTFYPIL